MAAQGVFLPGLPLSVDLLTVFPWFAGVFRGAEFFAAGTGFFAAGDDFLEDAGFLAEADFFVAGADFFVTAIFA